jgi:hypothetical protein
MTAKNSGNLTKTKKELQDEIDKVEDLLDHSVEKVRSDISSADPRKYIRNNPLPAIGVAIVSGFLMAKGLSSKKGGEPSSKEANLSAALLHEIKRVAVRQVAARAGKYIEEFLDDL